MLAQVVLTEIAGSRLHFAKIRVRPAGQAKSRPNPVSIALPADRAHDERMPATAAIIAKQIRRLSVIRHKQVLIAVHVVIGGCDGAADLWSRKPGPERAPTSAAAVPLIAENSRRCACDERVEKAP
jgi:hypothetical protein